MIPQLEQFINTIGATLSCWREYPLAPLTSYRVGGAADLLVRPRTTTDIARIITRANTLGIPWFALGGGANILISDRGVRGIVIDMASMDSFSIGNSTLECGAGLAVSSAAQRCAEMGYAGLHFLYSMPGSLGGAVWMNARCYGHSVDEVLLSAEIIDRNGREHRYYPNPEEYGYKKTPFQSNGAVIALARFRLHERDYTSVKKEMAYYRADRAAKGHFSAPSAGVGL